MEKVHSTLSANENGTGDLKMKRPKFYIGIDISSDTYAVSVGIEPWEIVGKTAEFSNNPDGYTAMLAWLEQQGVEVNQAVVCMEATGVYGEELAYYLVAHQFRVAVEPPLKVKRAFFPYGHKNDRVDSQQIAEYSYRFYDQLRFWQPREEILEQIQVLLSTREQFVRQKTAHLNALKAIRRKVVRTPLAEALHEQNIQRIKKDIKLIEEELRRLIDQDPGFGQMITLLMSTTGVGLLLAVNIMLIMLIFPETIHNYKQMAAYLGICPYEHRSGSSIYKPDASRFFGPERVRKLLYLAAMSLREHDTQFKQYFLRKTAEGKSRRLVLNNIANKLVKIMCAVVRTQTPYIKNYHSVNPALLKSPLTGS
jgi:transposase